MTTADKEVSYPLKVLQLTDTHLFGDDGRLLGVDTASSLADVIALALESRGIPDAVLLTGDLSQDESAESYRRLTRLVSVIPCPKYYLPGNHDAPALMSEVFRQPPFVIETAGSFVIGRWLFVLLDSTVPGQIGGHLSRKELSRLEAELGRHPEHHTVICLHHHPVPVESRWIDTISVDNGEDLLKIVDAHKQVRALIWGHIHQQYDGRRHGVLLMATPSTCVQFKPRLPDFGLDPQPPGFRWIEFDADGSINSQVMRVSELPAGISISSAGY